jgi:hypothetical protein
MDGNNLPMLRRKYSPNIDNGNAGRLMVINTTNINSPGFIVGSTHLFNDVNIRSSNTTIDTAIN